MLVPALVEVIFRQQLVVLDLDFLADRVALENYLLPTLREVLRHFAIEVPRVVSPLLNALQDRLPLLVCHLLLLVFDLQDRLIHVAVVVTEFGLLVSLSANR